MNAGDAFCLVGVDDKHLRVVISDPAVFPETVLFVNFTSYDPHEDQTVVLGIGDHPFITNRTCVSYSRARIATDAQLEWLKAAGRIVLHDPVSPELLQRLREGAATSNRAKTEHQELLREQGLVGP